MRYDGLVMEKLQDPVVDMAQCSLPVALEVMGERWSFMILRAAFNGISHFEGFLTQLGIARNILSNRLSRLVDHGILARNPCCDDRRRVEYLLTPKGFDLLPAMLALRQWGEKWGAGMPCNPVQSIRAVTGFTFPAWATRPATLMCTMWPWTAAGA